MDSYDFINSIQVEKENALARYKRFNNISKILTVLEVFIAVLVISWSSTRLPTVFKVSGEYLYACSSYVLNQHVVFLVGNLIGVICYFLSDQNDVGNGNVTVTVTAGSEVSEDDKVRYISIESVRSTDQCKLTESCSNIEPEVELPEMKQTVMEENYDKVVTSEETNLKIEMEAMEIKQAAKQLERFKRTQSVKLRQEMTMKPSGELRRSASERRRSTDTARGQESSRSLFETVERLSNEEFRLTVEAFILKQQRERKQETMGKL